MAGPERKKTATLVMKIVLVVSFFLFVLYMVVYMRRNFAWAHTIAMWCGMIFYQMMIRLTAPIMQQGFFGKQYNNPDSLRFRQHAWEPELFRILRVHTWVNMEEEESTYEGVWSPAEKINDTCHAEAIHGMAILLNLISVLISFFFDTVVYFSIPAAVFSLYDVRQIIGQRYRRFQLQTNWDSPYTKPL